MIKNIWDIVIPYTMMQGRIFSEDHPNYINFASIGIIIDHELNHGFDSHVSFWLTFFCVPLIIYDFLRVGISIWMEIWLIGGNRTQQMSTVGEPITYTSNIPNSEIRWINKNFMWIWRTTRTFRITKVFNYYTKHIRDGWWRIRLRHVCLILVWRITSCFGWRMVSFGGAFRDLVWYFLNIPFFI